MQRRRGIIYVLTIAAIFVMFAAEVKAADTTFHGYIESNLVMRDQNGIQYGFLDHLNGVQQRNTLKFDIDVYPEMAAGDFAVSKAHLTFRGAYDSIYDLRGNKYHDIREDMGLSRFDYGKKDVKFESDLREVFVDLTYNGALGSFFFRPGRQIVSWGEVSGNSTLLDVINPKDQSYQLFFQNPDDVKIPLYMARLNYSIPAMTDLSVNFDFLWVPDIRPAQFGPIDSASGSREGLNAPYVAPLFAAVRGFNVKQDVPTEEQEYGAKVTADIGERLSVSAGYYRDVNNDAGTVLTPDFKTMLFTHNVQHVYGAYASYNITEADIVIRGEIAHHTGEPISRRGFERTPKGFATFMYKPVTRWALMVDKKYMIPFITDHERTSFGFEWIHEKINEWDTDGALLTKVGGKRKDLDIFSFNMMWSWMQGRIAPLIAASWIPGAHQVGGGTAMIHPVVTWQISSNLYSSLGLHAFLGDKDAKSAWAGLIPTSELTIKLGYNW